MNMATLVPLPVVLPLLGAGATLMLSRRPRAQRYVTISILSAVVVIAAVLMVETDRNGPHVLCVGGWASPLGIALVAHRLSVLLLLVSALVTPLVLLYSLVQAMTGAHRSAPALGYTPH